ncbi:histidine kinase [Parabacteroides sp. PF5-6]|uniref:sensor histidine kinase n=1 Tax=Parabacteroides sp. PF5-6 TaxID=1742403 RepID=UPI0024071160|nr:histidine kinase [Parabacteroides sp. PF5-6]MDF9831314.1 signal transduction histidine kinase [Parabacteroides sp. PF5-6]
MKDTTHILAADKTRTGQSIRRYGWLIHAGAWAVLAAFPVVMTLTNHNGQPVSWDFYARFLIMFSSIVLMFYTNFLFLVDHFLFTKRSGWFILINIALIIGIITVVHCCMELLPEPAGRAEHRDRPPKDVLRLGFYLWNAMIYIFVIALSVAFRSTISWFRVEAERKELERNRSEAELQNLKSQLNPHFLFNTLNNIYSLIAISQEKAQESVHELSRLLRYVMHDSSQPLVPLEKELDFIRNYVELMRIRQPGHVTVETSLSAETPLVEVAPLLFISLIENAFKHGVSNSKPSSIRIEIHQNEEEVVCLIENSYFPKDMERDKSGSGIGLPNLRKRLDLLYPGKHELHCGREGENYRAYLSINLTQVPAL